MPRIFAYLFVIFASASALYADPLTCSVAHYKASPGLTAAVANNAATVTWDGDNQQELRLRLTINAGTPIIQELAIKRQGGAWTTLLSHAAPDFRVVSGLRRITNQQLDPQEGFILSRINGEWDIQSILSICPFREADCLRMMKRLVDRGVIGL